MANGELGHEPAFVRKRETMMSLKEDWESVDASKLTELASNWLLELRRDPSQENAEFGQEVVFMNFSAPPEIQWSFVLAAIDLAESDDELGHIAAGPLEHLLGFHGNDYIDRIEAQADADQKIALTLTGVWQHLTTDDVWARVRKIQARVPNPLPEYRPQHSTK